MVTKRPRRGRWILCAGCCAAVMAVCLFCYRDRLAPRKGARDGSLTPRQGQLGLHAGDDVLHAEPVRGDAAGFVLEGADGLAALTTAEGQAGLRDDVSLAGESATPELAAAIDEISRNAVGTIVEDYERRLFGAQSELEKTKAAFAEAFADREHTVSLLVGLLKKAGEEEKAWIRDALLRRFDSDSDPRVRRVCMVCLGRFHNEAHALHVRALATDEDRGVHRLAAYGLGTLGGEQEIGLLTQVAKDDEGDQREGRDLATAAVYALGEIGGKQAALALTQLWNNEEWSRDCRCAIINSVGRAGDPDSLGLLETTLQGSTSRDIRNAALVGVGHLARRNRTDPQVTDRAGTLLRRYLYEEDLYTRCIAIRALGWIGGREDVHLLQSFLEDNHSRIVTYSENGQVSEKVIYPVREDAQKAIDEIEARLASG